MPVIDLSNTPMPWYKPMKCHGRVRYRTEEDAKVGLEHMWRLRDTRANLEVYYCDACEGWHVKKTV